MSKKSTVGIKKKSPRRALCVGINDYPYEGNDLNGCVNDANAWAGLLTKQYGFPKSDVKVLLDSEATKKNIMKALKRLMAGARPGDILVFTNSSHGSYVADTSGDEEKYDEILCPYDIEDNHILDDELRELIANLKSGVNMTVILDNCFSGTATRAAVAEIIPGLKTPDDRRVRFLSPALRGLPVLQNPWSAKPNSKMKQPESKMMEILLSGCTDKEYSYDAFFDGVYHGALTYYAIQAIRQANYKLTYSQLHKRIVNLISDYPQHPQLEGKSSNKKRQIFS
ncbi:MAG TPA: caspase family protein [Thermodesulfobacteriota bacterium]|nr:caspase family protein [Thermodesulfobacteriota bacterium]